MSQEVWEVAVWEAMGRAGSQASLLGPLARVSKWGFLSSIAEEFAHFLKSQEKLVNHENRVKCCNFSVRNEV